MRGSGRAGPPFSIARAISYIENNLGGAIRQKDLLEAANMGSTKFKKTFKQVTGLTVTEFVSSERIELAKRLLTDHDMSIDEVAHRCGYARATSFSALFAKSVGMPHASGDRSRRSPSMTTRNRNCWMSPQAGALR